QRVRPAKPPKQAPRKGLAQRLVGALQRNRKVPSPPAVATPAKVEERVESFGLLRNVPRSLKTEVTRYLREREADPDWFDSTVLSARKSVKRLYAVLHVAPDERAQR